ncbi:MAG: DUF4342 domain-containing protein [Candidatus Undinarchaeales archaeon]|jgi:hypothetical protein|nr:DUF4342 domain-containing protein [Candidatus Undinarchaeales archaeon]MDP7492674.1 DUF4342 domain-containing protein [Candidatus Undinarchaeales archaeon]
MTKKVDARKKERIEEYELDAGELVDRVKDIVHKGNVRRLIVRRSSDDVLLEVPLTGGVAMGGALTIFAPHIIILGALAALLTKVKVQIVRVVDVKGPAEAD